MGTRESLLDTALELFADRGYDAVGVQEIVAAAGVTKPTLYHHFQSKLGLLEALLDEGAGPFLGALGAAAAYEGGLPCALDRVAAACLDLAASRPPFYRLWLSLASAPPGHEGRAAARRLADRRLLLLEGLFERAARDHGNMRGRHRRYALTFAAALDAYAALVLDGRARADGRLRYELVHQFSHGIYSLLIAHWAPVFFLLGSIPTGKYPGATKWRSVMPAWASDAVFYHLFPLGALGAPSRNDFRSPPAGRFERLHAWLDPVVASGATAVLLGPVFESSAHGYDVADYRRADRRLGSDEALSGFVGAARGRGLRVVLDGVFHHVGRDFWAFRDVLARGPSSPYRSWFFLDERGRSPYGDPFAYEGWQGHYDLVKLNVAEPAVREHLFGAVRAWVEGLGIDGLRLDAADRLDLTFQRDLAAFCRALKPDFWLVGEVVHGDYNRWAGPGALDSVTNYELYKALYSSHNDANYFELAHSLERQFGPKGLYRELALYSFADNHDVERVASRLADPAHLYPLYAALFTAPGVPSVYYGSEWGVEGRKAPESDAPLRPSLEPAALAASGPHPHLANEVARLARIRRAHPALCRGDYRTLHVAHRQFVFARSAAGQTVVVALNAASRQERVRVTLPGEGGGRLVDMLNGGEAFEVRGGAVDLELYPCWARVLRLEPAPAAGAPGALER